MMRQAGRALPEYRALREKYSFEQLVKTPELAAEVTLQPIRRFGFDAAIVFSDILVVPEALGQPYKLHSEGGIAMEFAIRSKSDIARLDFAAAHTRLDYVADALRLVRRELGDKTALIGFAGSPWTLATFMIEGGSSENFNCATALFREDPKTYFAFAEKLTATVAAFLQMQAECGVDAIQVFDTHGGLLDQSQFWEVSGRWINQLVSAVQKRAGRTLSPDKPADATAVTVVQNDVIPVIVFSLGTHHNWADLVATGATVLGIDWHFPLEKAREILPKTIAIQGNLRPDLLSSATPEVVAAETRRLLTIMHGRNGYIFNLGHGVPPDARLDNIAAVVDTVQRFTASTM